MTTTRRLRDHENWRLVAATAANSSQDAQLRLCQMGQTSQMTGLQTSTDSIQGRTDGPFRSRLRYACVCVSSVRFRQLTKPV